jgi:hypothetical protein
MGAQWTAGAVFTGNGSPADITAELGSYDFYEVGVAVDPVSAVIEQN